MQKKLLSFIVLALFLVSMIPLAFAEDTATLGASATVSTDGTQVSADAGAQATSSDGANKTRQERQDQRQKQQEQRTERQNVRKEGQELRQGVRAKIEDHKKAFADFRDQLKSCAGQKTEQCEGVRQNVRNEAKLYLKDTVQEVQDALKTLREKIAASSLENKDELLKALDNATAKMSESQSHVDGLPDNVTAAQVKEATESVKKGWNDARKTLKIQAELHANAGVHGVLVRAEKLEMRLDKATARLKTNGTDTSSVDAQIAAFKNHIQLARAQADIAQAKLDDARKDGANLEQDVKDAHAALVEARMHLNQAHDALKEVVKAFKSVKDGEKTMNEEAEKEDHHESSSTNVSASASA